MIEPFTTQHTILHDRANSTDADTKGQTYAQYAVKNAINKSNILHVKNINISQYGRTAFVRTGPQLLLQAVAIVTSVEETLVPAPVPSLTLSKDAGEGKMQFIN